LQTLSGIDLFEVTVFHPETSVIGSDIAELIGNVLVLFQKIEVSLHLPFHS
jgi:hypothetical protein